MNGCKKTRAMMDAVKKAGGGRVQTSADTARKLATEMGGMKKGGAAKAKPGLAVMIAIGKTKPVKEKSTGEMYASKAAMKKHEAKESSAMQRAERKMKKGGVAKIREGISTRPTTASGRRISDAELRQANRDTGGMSAAQVKAAGQAIARGNRAPYERMPTDEEVARMLGRKNGGPVYKAKGGAGKVRKGMMTPEGDIKKVVKPKKGIGGIM